MAKVLKYSRPEPMALSERPEKMTIHISSSDAALSPYLSPYMLGEMIDRKLRLSREEIGNPIGVFGLLAALLFIGFCVAVICIVGLS